MRNITKILLCVSMPDAGRNAAPAVKKIGSDANIAESSASVWDPIIPELGGVRIVREPRGIGGPSRSNLTFLVEGASCLRRKRF